MNEQKIGRPKVCFYCGRPWPDHCRLRDATRTMTCPDCGRKLWIISDGLGETYLLCECGGKLMRPHVDFYKLRKWLRDRKKRIIVRQLPPETAND